MTHLNEAEATEAYCARMVADLQRQHPVSEKIMRQSIRSMAKGYTENPADLDEAAEALYQAVQDILKEQV